MQKWKKRAAVVNAWRRLHRRRAPEAMAPGLPQAVPARQAAVKPRPSRLAVGIHALRGERRLCQLLATGYVPAIVLPLVTALRLLGDQPLRALLCSWLCLGLFAAGLFLILMREADADFRLRRLGQRRRRRPRSQRAL